MGHWSNSAAQILSAASGAITRVDFDTTIIPGNQIAQQDGVYDYAYHVNLMKPSGEIGPSRVTSVLDILRMDGSVDLVRESRSFTDIDGGTEESLAHTGQTPLSSGDAVRVRVNLDDLSQSGVLMTRIKQSQSSLTLQLVGASPSGNFSGTIFPTMGLEPGYSFYRTDLSEKFTYTGIKWLGELRSDGAGRGGIQLANSYFRRFNGLLMNDTRGIYIPFDATITHVSWSKEDTTTGLIQIERNGVVLGAMVANGVDGGGSMDIDFPANGNLSLFWNSSFTTSNVQISIHYRRRG